MSLVYIVYARFEWLSFDRQERYVRPIAEKMISITERLDKEIAVLLNASRTKRRMKNDLSSTAKVSIFMSSAIFVIVGVAVNLFLTVIQKVFFNLLIGWKATQLGGFSAMFAKFAALVGQLTQAIHIPMVLITIILYPFFLLYQLAEVFNVGSFYSLLTVTCQGAKSPIELFIDSFVLGVAILFINSKYVFLWAASLLEMNKSFVVRYWIQGKKLLSYHFVLSVIALGLTSTNPFITVLRFFLSFIDFGAFFVVNHVKHDISKACVGIVGFQNQELWLVDTTSVLVWLLIAPMLYITAEIVCPKGGFTSAETHHASASVMPLPNHLSDDDDDNSSMYNSIPDSGRDNDSSIASILENNPHDERNMVNFLVSENDHNESDSLNSSVFSYTDSEQSQSPAQLESLVSDTEVQNNAVSMKEIEPDHSATKQPLNTTTTTTTSFSALSGAIRYAWSHAALLFSTDLIFIYAMNVWVAHCQKLHSLEGFLKLRADRRWDPLQIQESVHRFRSEHVETDSRSRSMSYFSHYEIAARELDIQLEKKWDRVAHHSDSTKLPPYYRLCAMVQQELVKKLGYLGVFWVLSIPISYVVGYSGIGHLLSIVGRKYWGIVFWKYYLLLCVSVGYWTDESYEAYELEDLVSEFSVADPDEATIVFLSLTIASRVILLQALGGPATLISIVVINMCGSPLFVFSPKLRENIPPFIYFNSREVALRREKLELLGAHHAHHHLDDSIRVEEWAIGMRSLSIFLTESRLIVFFAKLVSLSMTMIILQGVELSTETLALLLLFMLPYFIGSALVPLIYVGKRINLTDVDFEVVFGCLKRTHEYVWSRLCRWGAFLLSIFFLSHPATRSELERDNGDIHEQRRVFPMIVQDSHDDYNVLDIVDQDILRSPSPSMKVSKEAYSTEENQKVVVGNQWLNLIEMRSTNLQQVNFSDSSSDDYASLDSDSDGIEGNMYLSTEDEEFVHLDISHECSTYSSFEGVCRTDEEYEERV